MNARHRKTLASLFAIPTPADIRWSEIVSLMRDLGEVDEKRSGSRVAFTVKERTMVTHKPHPRREVGRASVREIRGFLQDLGINP